MALYQEFYTPSYKGNVRRQVRRRRSNTEHQHKNYETGTIYHTKLAGKHARYRSSYERIFLQSHLDNKGIKRIYFEPFKIPYEYDGETRNYIPDALVLMKNNDCYLIEIKPASMVNEEPNPQKFAAAEKYCKKKNYTFLVVTEKHLRTKLRAI